MKDWKKAVLWTLVGFCVISAVVGIFGLISFLQMATIKLSNLSINDEVRTLFTVDAILTLVCAIVCTSLVSVVCIQLLKHKTPFKSFFIVTFVLSVFFILYAFLTPSILKIDTYKVLYGENFSYNTYVHYETYLSAVLSTFVPLLVAAGILFGYFIYTKKHPQQEGAAETSVSEPPKN